MVKKLNRIRNKDKKSDYYWEILSKLAGLDHKISDKILKEHKLYPAPGYVDMSFVNGMLNPAENIICF